MNLYLIYSESTILITNDFNDKNAGYSIKYENINKMLNEFRQDLRNNEYDYVEFFCEECADENNNTIYIEFNKDEAINLI